MFQVFTLLCRVQEEPKEKPLPPAPDDSFLDLSPGSSPTLSHTDSPRPPNTEGKHVSFLTSPHFSYGSGMTTRPYSATLVGSDRPFSGSSKPPSTKPSSVGPSPPQSPPQSHAPAPADPAKPESQHPAKPKPSDTNPPPMGPVQKAVTGEAVKSVVAATAATIVIAGSNGLIGQPP